MRLIDADAIKYDFNIKTYADNRTIVTSLLADKDTIDAMPTIEPNRWIPVSERLPEKDGEYLVESTRGYEVLYYREEEKQFGLMVFNFAGKVGFVPKKVYEWMPIPGVEE